MKHMDFATWFVAGFVLASIGISASALHGSSGNESLILNPPFRTAERQETRPVETIATQGSINERFVLSGFFDDGSEMRFSIRDQRSAKPHWVVVGDFIEGVRVEAWDADKMGVILSQDGKRELVMLRQPTNQSFNRPMPQMFNPMPTQAPTTYPSPPPTLPKPSQLMEQLRREQARQAQN
jgi:hypothetical protein